MNRLIYLSVSALLVTALADANAQVEYNTTQNVRIYAPAYTPYNTIEGSPYVPGDTVKNGWLVNGTKRVAAKLRYNSYSGRVEYLQDNKIVTPTNAIAEFVIIAADTMRFQKGFPATVTRTESDFYQVLFNGQKTKLLKNTSSTVKSTTEIMHNDFGKQKFQTREEYYVWVARHQQSADTYYQHLSDAEMKSVLLNKKSLVGLLPQQADAINRYIADNKIKLNSWAEFARVLTYLDTQ